VIITIASGKGGTGKTTLAVNMAEYLKQKKEKICLLDCDVEAPNDKLFLNNLDFSEYDVLEPRPVWNNEKCNGCGICKEVCRYNAIARLPGKILIFNELCHSCGACKYMCPNNAITEEDYSIGKIYESSFGSGNNFVYGELNIGETASPALVKAVKNNIQDNVINIIDAPPGTGCSVVSTLEESDVVVLVTEPTPFGLHDLKLAVQLTAKLGIPFGVVINRSDNNDKLILNFLSEYDIPLFGKIPFERKFAEAYSNGAMLINLFADFELEIENIYKNILKFVASPIVANAICIEEKKAIKNQTPENYFDFVQDKIGRSLIREIMIISGKGGTGKTTVSAAFSYLAKGSKTVFEDCDVDAADLHLLLKPVIIEKTDFSGGRLAEINSESCERCGKCAHYCKFGAIELMTDGKFRINDLKCEGCGFCLLVCPTNSVSDREKINGEEYISDTQYGPMVHAKLGVSEENSGKLVASVRSKASDLADNVGKNMIIGDGPPGVGCPVIASITGIDLAVVVTEPTVSGMHDMLRVLNLTKHFNITSKIIINKSDLNLKMTKKIKLASVSYNSEVIAEIPFDRNVNDALISGKTVIEHGKGAACRKIIDAWEKVNNV
jgi:MinD superfamily P-loop ATPase